MKDKDFLKKYAEKLFSLLEIEGELTVTEDDENINLNLQGENLGHIIGFRGEVLGSFERVFSFALRKEKGDEVVGKRVTFDVGDYKKRREEKLVFIAQRVADEVRSSGEPHKFSPMLASERRIIHNEISKYPSLVSYSMGEGQDRRLIVEPSEVK
ncbi:KH domain-containing protein [Patescibacteria group bacterium]|nr:KH domain-containing protein [Patescibacteria group bacterium]